MELDAALSSGSIRCPRCDEGMGSFVRRARSAGSGTADVRAEMCDGCGGVWVDGSGVAKAYPAFEHLVDRVAEAVLPVTGAAQPIAMCPRCKGVTRPFGFFGLVLDVCLDCQGLWVDADELEDLARTADRADGLPAPAPRHRGYRENAVAVARSGAVLCKRCDMQIDLAAAQMTSEGPMCPTCAETFRNRRLDAALKDYEPPTEPLVDLSFFKDFLFGLPVVLGAAISAGTRCSRCGCHGASRCGC